VHQFTNRGVNCHQRSCQGSNSSNPNPYNHPSLIPSLASILLASAWTWVLSLDVLGSFHLGFCCFRLYNGIHITFRRDVQVAFHFPLDKLPHDPDDVATWHLLLLSPQSCFILPPCGKGTQHKEIWAQFKHFLTCDWENL
jgi:hypothetical protein